MTDEYYNKLIQYQKNYPELTYDNKGYDEIAPEVKEEHKKVIEEISEILKQTVKGFVRFQNFKLRKDGSFAIRLQCYYDESFIGVEYLNIVLFKNFEA